MNQSDLAARAPANFDGPSYRELPGNLEAEQALLGACLINNSAYGRVSEFLRPEHFLESIHGKIFEIIGNTVAINKVANPVTVKNFLPGDLKIGEFTIAKYLAHLAGNAVSIINAADYGSVIFDHYQRRELIDIGEEMVNTAYDAQIEVTPKKQINAASERLFKLTTLGSTATQTEMSGSAWATAYIASITRDESRKHSKGVPMPLRELNAVLSEDLLEATNLYGMISSSGEGKSSLMLQIAYEAASQGHPTAVFSYDQNPVQCMTQMVAQHAGIEARRQKAGDLNPSQFESAFEIANRIARMPFAVIKCSSTFDNADKLTAKAGDFLRKHANGKTPLLIWDHASAIPPRKDDKNADEGSKARGTAQALKDFLDASGSAGLMLQQRSGTGMARFNPRPIPSDVYGGEGARQPFDAIFYLFRAEEHMRRQVDTAKDTKNVADIEARFKNIFPTEFGLDGTAEIGTLKVRFGKVGLKRYVKFIGEYTKYAGIHTMQDEMESML